MNQQAHQIKTRFRNMTSLVNCIATRRCMRKNLFLRGRGAEEASRAHQPTVESYSLLERVDTNDHSQSECRECRVLRPSFVIFRRGIATARAAASFVKAARETTLRTGVCNHHRRLRDQIKLKNSFLQSAITRNRIHLRADSVA